MQQTINYMNEVVSNLEQQLKQALYKISQYENSLNSVIEERLKKLTEETQMITLVHQKKGEMLEKNLF